MQWKKPTILELNMTDLNNVEGETIGDKDEIMGGTRG